MKQLDLVDTQHNRPNPGSGSVADATQSQWAPNSGEEELYAESFLGTPRSFSTVIRVDGAHGALVIRIDAPSVVMRTQRTFLIRQETSSQRKRPRQIIQGVAFCQVISCSLPDVLPRINVPDPLRSGCLHLSEARGLDGGMRRHWCPGLRLSYASKLALFP